MSDSAKATAEPIMITATLNDTGGTLTDILRDELLELQQRLRAIQPHDHEALYDILSDTLEALIQSRPVYT